MKTLTTYGYSEREGYAAKFEIEVHPESWRPLTAAARSAVFSLALTLQEPVLAIAQVMNKLEGCPEVEEQAIVAAKALWEWSERVREYVESGKIKLGTVPPDYWQAVQKAMASLK